jgi:hypothetical protein
VLDALAMEAAGLPTVTIIGDRFEVPARIHAKAAGLPDLPLLIEPTNDVSVTTNDGLGTALHFYDFVVASLTAANSRPDSSRRS